MAVNQYATVVKASQRGYRPAARTLLKEFRDRHYDDLSFFPWLVSGSLLLAVALSWIGGRL